MLISKIYFKIWADAILSINKFRPSSNWRIILFIHISWVQALNLWVITIWLKYFNLFDIPLIEFHFLPGTILNQFLAFSAEFAFPFAILNYYLIFYKDRYKQVIRKYPIRSRYAWNYALIIVLGSFLSGVLHGLVLPPID